MNRKEVHVIENLSDDWRLGCWDAGLNGCKCNSSSFATESTRRRRWMLKCAIKPLQFKFKVTNGALLFTRHHNGRQVSESALRSSDPKRSQINNQISTGRCIYLKKLQSAPNLLQGRVLTVLARPVLWPWVLGTALFFKNGIDWLLKRFRFMFFTGMGFSKGVVRRS